MQVLVYFRRIFFPCIFFLILPNKTTKLLDFWKENYKSVDLYVFRWYCQIPRPSANEIVALRLRIFKIQNIKTL